MVSVRRRRVAGYIHIPASVGDGLGAEGQQEEQQEAKEAVETYSKFKEDGCQLAQGLEQFPMGMVVTQGKFISYMYIVSIKGESCAFLSIQLQVIDCFASF